MTHKLIEEVNKKSKEIITDSIPMSIGELISLYRDKELVLEKNFKESLKWDKKEKLKFIESLLLGRPLPSILVEQKQNGIWELIGEINQIATILEFIGELKIEGNNEKLILEGTEDLPSLDKIVWNKEEDKEDSIELPSILKIKIKRAKFQVNVISNKRREL